MSDLIYAGQDSDFFRTYKKDIHEYTMSFLTVFYRVMTIVFIAILIGTFCIPDTPTMQHIRELTPFGLIFALYMAVCYILYCTIIRKHIKASFLFTQITLVLFGALLLWLDFATPGSLAVFIPVYFALFPMLLTVPVPALLLDLAVLYIITIAGTVIYKEPKIAVEDIINVTICLAAGFLIGCKNIRSKLAEIKASSNNKLNSEKQKAIIDALIDEYDFLGIADYDTDIITTELISDKFSTNTNTLLKTDSLSNRIQKFAELDVHPDDKERYLKSIEKNNVIENMKDSKSMVINFRVMINGEEQYEVEKILDSFTFT